LSSLTNALEAQKKALERARKIEAEAAEAKYAKLFTVRTKQQSYGRR
jgi:hypothetical protein